MKYFIDTHDRAEGSFPGQEVSAEEFVVGIQPKERYASAVAAVVGVGSEPQ